MSSVMRSGARATSAVAAFLLVILSLGVAGAAYADPGGGNGNDGTNPGNGNAYGADNGNGSDNGNAYGTDNGAGAQSAGAESASTAAAAKSDNSSAKGSVKSSSGGKAGDHKTKGTAGTSGNPKSPQPISGADDNPGGANGQCPAGVYCSTRNGSPSGNGNGGGKAVGKPCAGCVGKADNKNPHGQMPGPQDHNNGYECDGNNGIAKTNPAHSGCKSAPTPPKPPTPPTPPTPPSPPTPPTPPTPPGSQCPPGTVLVNGVCIAGEEEVTPPTVLGEEAFRPPVKVKAAAAGVLPATGSSSDLGLLAGFGFTLLALGAGVMMRRRSA